MTKSGADKFPKNCFKFEIIFEKTLKDVEKIWITMRYFCMSLRKFRKFEGNLENV